MTREHDTANHLNGDLAALESLLFQAGDDIADRQRRHPVAPGAAQRLRLALAAADRAAAKDSTPAPVRSLAERLREALGGLGRGAWSLAGAGALATLLVVAAMVGGGALSPAIGEVGFRMGALAMGPTEGSDLRAGDVVATNDGGALLNVGDMLEGGERRVQVLLAPNSELALLDDARLELRRGAAWIDVVKNSGPFRVATPEGDYVAVVGTTFGVERGASGALALAVNEGRVEIASGAAKSFVDAGAVSSALRGAVAAPTAGETALPAWAREIQSAALAAKSRFYPSAQAIPAQAMPEGGRP